MSLYAAINAVAKNPSQIIILKILTIPVQTTNTDLQAQITSIGRMSGGGSSMEVRALTAQATNAERRFTNVQNQLAAAEEKVTSVNQKTHVADNKWVWE